MNGNYFFLILILCWYQQAMPGIAAGTKIVTPAGSVAVEMLSVGNIINSYDINTQSIIPTTIKYIFSYQSETCFALETDDEIVYTSPNQPFYDYAQNKFIMAQEVNNNTVFLTYNHKPRKCIECYPVNEPTIFYELVIDEPHLFFSSDAQLLTHNMAVALTPVRWFLGTAIACVYLNQSFKSFSDPDQARIKITQEVQNFCAQFQKSINSGNFSQQLKKNPAYNPNPPLLAGIRPDPEIYYSIKKYPLLHGPICCTAEVTKDGDILAHLNVLRSNSLQGNSVVCDWQEFGSELFPRNNILVKSFVAAEDKKQLDDLRNFVKTWPVALKTKLSQIRCEIGKEIPRLQTLYGCFEKTIYETTFGMHAIYRMVERNISPLLLLSIIKHGIRVPAHQAGHSLFYDQQNNIVILLDHNLKKVITIGWLKTEMKELDPEVQEEQPKNPEHIQDQPDSKKSENQKEKSGQPEDKTNINELDENKIKHIIEGSQNSDHKWEKLVPNKNWDDIKEIIKEVIKSGNEKPYKHAKSKIKIINNNLVEVTYKEIDGIKKIGNAWIQ